MWVFSCGFVRKYFYEKGIRSYNTYKNIIYISKLLNDTMHLNSHVDLQLQLLFILSDVYIYKYIEYDVKDIDIYTVQTLHQTVI